MGPVTLFMLLLVLAVAVLHFIARGRQRRDSGRLRDRGGDSGTSFHSGSSGDCGLSDTPGGCQTGGDSGASGDCGGGDGGGGD